MSDKELDNLFKTRFESLEMPVSAGSWNKIAGELNDGKKKRRSFSPAWMAAASVLLVVAAAFWLYRPVKVIELRGPENSQTAAVIKKESSVLKPVTQTAEERTIVVENSREQNNKNFMARVGSQNQVQKTIQANTASTKTETELPKVPGISKPTLVAENSDGQVQSQPAQELIADNSNTEEPAEENTAHPRKVRGIGGLVNFVVAQVDRRQDKLIEFKEGEEGTEISGINLGLVKFKSRNK